MTWGELIEIEPRVEALRKEAAAADGSAPDFCANDLWFCRFKPRVTKLAGWDAEKPELRTPEAYDLAYQTVYNQLPACRRCGCACGV